MNSSEENWEPLFVRYFDGTLDDDGIEELDALLESSPEARSRFNDAVLIAQTIDEADAIPSPKIRRFPLVWSGIGALAAAVVVAAIFFVLQKPESEAIATLETTSGTVEVIGEVHSGELVTSSGTDGSTLLTFHDGTRLVLAGDTSLTVSEDEVHGKHVEVYTGSVAASVEKQPTGKPMILVTPQARVEVLGTEFSLDTSPDATGLGVTEGRVRVVRLSDGESVDVEEDRFVVAGGDREFRSQPRPSIPDELEIQFENGLPPSWLYGSHLPAAADLPARVGTERRPGQAQGAHHQIFTQNPWVEGMSGLFEIHNDTQLHVRYRMADPGYLQVFIGTRLADRPASRTVNFLAHDLGKNQGADEWRTLTIPVAELESVGGTQRADGRLAIFLLFDTLAKDRGLEIESIRISRE
ncbi:MAG: FecR family protein [Verrucomicrobiota bacterium]